MNHARMAELLAVLGHIGGINSRLEQDRRYLESKGWICLGEEAISGVVHWTNLERGLADGGPVTFQRAIWIQRTKDAIAKGPAHSPDGEGASKS